MSKQIALADNRILQACIMSSKQEEFWVSTVYAPSDPKEKIFWENAQAMPWPINLILGGDYNTWINAAVKKWPPTSRIPKGAEFFANFKVKCNLIDVGSPLSSPIKSITRWEFAYKDQVLSPSQGTK